jgi:thymidylate synthase ThyX
MENYFARFVKEPVVAPIGEMRLIPEGTDVMIEWLKSRAPNCLPDGIDSELSATDRVWALFPHQGLREDGQVQHSDNELLVELAGRKCYNSFGLKAGRKTNREYIAHMQSGDVPHSSVLYHAKMSFFIAGVSRRVSHELIRNYVGADRDEEGSPSQESTRYVENAGFFVIPPKYLAEVSGSEEHLDAFKASCQESYQSYREMIEDEIACYTKDHGGAPPKGMDFKRILEAASSLLLRKKLCVETWPNLFPQPWMAE